MSENQTSAAHHDEAPQSAFADEARRCRRAQEAWASLAVADRLRHVRAFRHLLCSARDRIYDAIEADIGKPHRDTLAGDILPLAEACRFLERFAAKALQPRPISLWSRPLILWGQSDRILRRPRGVVGIIGTWNLPFMLSGVQSLHALVAGNGVLFKPSELAARSGQLLAAMLAQAGFPVDLVCCLPATREAGAQLAAADIDHLIFTGRSSTGRTLASNLGRRLVTSTLELSGCDPLFLLDDGNLGLAARGAWFGATINAGQACVGIRRAFVPRSRLQEFIDELNPLVLKAEPLPAVLGAQIDLTQRVIQDALERGASLIRREGNQIPPMHTQPALLINVPPDAEYCRESIFAPLLAVMPYDRLDDAVIANASCPYRLSASIFTADRDRALDLAARIPCGHVCVNDVLVPIGHPGTPFGGRGSSGWGVTMGIEGLLEMTVPQVVSFTGGKSRPHFDWQGSSWLIQQDTLEAWTDFCHASSLGTRLQGGWRFLLRFLFNELTQSRYH